MGRLSNMDLKAVDSTKQKKKVKKKRAASELDLAGITDVTGHREVKDGLHVNDDSSEPTMGEKLASLNIVDNGENPEKEESALGTKPPSADSVHVLLKQALHADDRELLLKCLFTQDEKVITNSTSLLSPSDVLKLLGSLISILQSRGTVVACALPWLRSLLLQHASCIISQESSLLALNSLYQLIDSRISTFRPTLQLSNSMDFLFSGITDSEADEIIAPVIYEDKDDDSDEYESESESEEDDAMENDQENVEEQPEDTFNGFSDFEGSDDGMSDRTKSHLLLKELLGTAEACVPGAASCVPSMIGIMLY